MQRRQSLLPHSPFLFSLIEIWKTNGSPAVAPTALSSIPHHPDHLPFLRQLFTALVPLIRESLYRNAEKASEVAELLPSGFHPDLGKLLGKQISKQIPAWRQSALQNQISPPRLLDVDWRVDMQTSSNLLARMAVPTVFVEMKVHPLPSFPWYLLPMG